MTSEQFYLKNNDETKEHPEPFPWIIIVNDERNVPVDVISHPQLAAESANRTQQDENDDTPDDVDVHLLLQHRAFVTGSTVI